MILRTGIDMVEISRIADLDPEIRPGFLKRVFTPEELLMAGNSNPFLAGRFAAKEAVAKALGCGIGPVSWQEIEILRGDTKQPRLLLSGEARRLSDQIGISSWAVSISHTDTLATAVAVAIGIEEERF